LRFACNNSSWTNRLLKANDYGSVQINIAKIDPVTGVYTKEFQTIALSGYIRARVSGCFGGCLFARFRAEQMQRINVLTCLYVVRARVATCHLQGESDQAVSELAHTF
jgi:hypothetical protein